MDWLRRLLEAWRTRRQAVVRRVVILRISGLEPALVDRYLDEGLLHYLALLADIGTRADCCEVRPKDIQLLALAAGKVGLRTVALASLLLSQPPDADAICAADLEQQERLIAALGHFRPGIVLCDFDMPARLTQFFGPDPTENQRHILRDVYARMDEVVGKAFSFVDDRTVLLVAISAPSDNGSATSPAAAGLLFSSRRLAATAASEILLPATLLGLFGPGADKP
jgi:hypothetical protein